MSDKPQKRELIEDIKVDNIQGTISFKRTYFFTPFKWNIYPFQKDRFAIVLITSPSFLRETTLFSQIKNAFLNPCLISASNVREASLKIGNLSASAEQLKNQLAIFDLTETTEFKTICDKVIPVPPIDPSLSWLQLLEIRRTLMPNLMIKSNDSSSQLNYSYTIWLATKLEQVPIVLRSSAHMMIATFPEGINALLHSTTGINEIASDIPISLIVTNTLSRDIELMTVPNYRFYKEL